MHVAVVGATGAVGREIATILEERRFPTERVTFLASARSSGTRILFRGQAHEVKELSEGSFEGVNLALFSAGSDIVRGATPHARACGTTIVDNSSAFRMDPEVPLVIPEINGADAAQHNGVIANPNCSTIIMALAVWPLHCANPVKRLVVSTYQAISGAGARAMQELEDQTRDLLNGRPVKPQVLPHQSAFNLYSHNSAIDESGYNTEERKMVDETRKIFHEPDLQVSATCIRVPVPRAHSESINITFRRPMSADQARQILESAKGVRIVDDPKRNHFPMPIEASGNDEVLVGRLRRDNSDPTGCSFWMFVCGDQLRKGAALNAVQIAELVH